MGEVFKSIEAVRRFLLANGYSVTKSTIGRHSKDGYIRAGATEEQAFKYAKAFLKEAATGKRKDEAVADEHRRYLRGRAEKIEQEVAQLRLKTLEQEGKLIPREQRDQDLAARAVMLKGGLKHLVQSNVNSWVHLVGGDPRKAGDLQRELLGNIERMLSGYARADNIVLEFEDDPLGDDDLNTAVEQEVHDADRP